MIARWRGRRAAVLAISLSLSLSLAGVAVAAAVLAGATRVSGGDRATLTVSLPDGTVMRRVALPGDGSFALRYRNSLYGSLAEERFVAGADRSLRLVGLAAEQLAVLEEYYAIDVPARRARDGRWVAPPAHEPVLRELRVAASDLGERTLLVEGEPPLDLWRLVDDSAPDVLLAVDP